MFGGFFHNFPSFLLQKRLETELFVIHGKFEIASSEIERLQNITRTTEAPPTTSTARRITTTKSTTTTTTPTTTTPPSTTVSVAQDQGLEFRVEDTLYSLSNQIGMMEEKLELCMEILFDILLMKIYARLKCISSG